LIRKAFSIISAVLIGIYALLYLYSIYECCSYIIYSALCIVNIHINSHINSPIGTSYIATTDIEKNDYGMMASKSLELRSQLLQLLSTITYSLPSADLTYDKGFNVHGSPASKMSADDRKFSDEGDEEEDGNRDNTFSDGSTESSFQTYSKSLDSIVHASDPVENRRLLKMHAHAIDANLFTVLISSSSDVDTVCSSLRLMVALIQENAFYVNKFLSPAGDGEAWFAFLYILS
jgi:hypothetical protein